MLEVVLEEGSETGLPFKNCSQGFLSVSCPRFSGACLGRYLLRASKMQAERHPFVSRKPICKASCLMTSSGHH